MELDDPVLAIAICRNEIGNRSPSRYNGVPPLPRAVGKRKLVGCVPLGDVNQLFLDDSKVTARQAVIRLSVGEIERVAQECSARLCFLAQVVDGAPRHDHLRYKRHAIGITVTYVMEQIPHMCVAAVLVAYGGRGLHEGVICQRTQESDRIKQVRLAHSVRPNDTRKRTKPQVHVDQILEAGDSKSSQHETALPIGAQLAQTRPTGIPRSSWTYVQPGVMVHAFPNLVTCHSLALCDQRTASLEVARAIRDDGGP